MADRSPRLRFNSIEKMTDQESGLCYITVKLSFNDKIFQGQCQGFSGQYTELELVASATLNAVEGFVNNRFQCRLLDVDRIPSIGTDLIVLLVKVIYEGQELQIFGSCRITDEVTNTAARAALDATNRYVELILNDDQRLLFLDNSSSPDLIC